MEKARCDKIEYVGLSWICEEDGMGGSVGTVCVLRDCHSHYGRKNVFTPLQWTKVLETEAEPKRGIMYNRGRLVSEFP